MTRREGIRRVILRSQGRIDEHDGLATDMRLTPFNVDLLEILPVDFAEITLVR